MTRALPLIVAPSVGEALEAGAPVVALEATLVSHGFPVGRGAAVAAEAAVAIEAAGATPATIGLIDGAIRVGLDQSELERFSASPDARKVSARDIASCLARGELGATTVGATLAICRLAGLRAFATGGIGGVHRGYAERPDISSDLRALAGTQTLVVCSGVKSLLDVIATHELLESLGVPVLGWQTNTLPLFYSRDGGPPLEQVDTAAQVAAIVTRHWALGGHGLVVARPPDPEIPGAQVEGLFDQALRAAERAGISGGALTPFVLSQTHEASERRSLDVNHRLIVDNAALAATIAGALGDTQEEESQ